MKICNLRSRYFVLNINFDVSDSFVRREATLMFYWSEVRGKGGDSAHNTTYLATKQLFCEKCKFIKFMDIFSNNLLETLIKGETEHSSQQELKIYLLYCQETRYEWYDIKWSIIKDLKGNISLLQLRQLNTGKSYFQEVLKSKTSSANSGETFKLFFSNN